MSRFIELLEAQTEALNQAGFKTILLDILERLEARIGSIEMRFPYLSYSNDYTGPFVETTITTATGGLEQDT